MGTLDAASSGFDADRSEEVEAFSTSNELAIVYATFGFKVCKPERKPISNRRYAVAASWKPEPGR